jgi:hypothetical protein
MERQIRRETRNYDYCFDAYGFTSSMARECEGLGWNVDNERDRREYLKWSEEFARYCEEKDI